MKSKINHLLNNSILLFFNIIIFWILFLLFFIDKKIIYARANSIAISNATLLSFGIVVIWLAYALYKNIWKQYIYKLTEQQFKMCIYSLFIILLLVQCIIVYGIYFETGWDAAVLRKSSDLLAKGNKMDVSFRYPRYFLKYNNNVFLTVVFTITKQLFNHISFLSGNKVVVMISVLCVNISGLLTILTVDRLFNKRGMTILSFILFSLLIGISPWIVIPYSDTYVILFTSLCLYLYISRDDCKHLWFRWLTIFFCGGIGFLIKPTCIIVLMAICIAEVWKWFFVNGKEKMNKLKTIPFIILAYALVICLNKGAYAYVGFEKNNDRSAPMTHYAMMGLNNITDGTYYRDDVRYTFGFKTHEEKVDGNIKVIKQRLRSYGPIGYFKFLCRKIVVNYNDGTFAWGREGGFFENAHPEKGNPLQVKLKSLYYEGGKNYGKLACMQHSIWLTLLFMMIFLNIKKWREFDSHMIVIIMTIIGITLFTLIFEARARYLFLYGPFFIILGIAGLNELISYNEKSHKFS